jgi:hypothetical protein
MVPRVLQAAPPPHRNTVLIERLCAQARQGDEFAHWRLWAFAIDATALGESLLAPHQEYMVMDAPLYKRSRGRRSWDGRPRIGESSPFHLCLIAATVEVLVSKGVPRTRNRTSPDTRPTAYSIVAKALAQLGVKGKTPGAVEKISEKYRAEGLALRREAGGFSRSGSAFVLIRARARTSDGKSAI